MGYEKDHEEWEKQEPCKGCKKKKCEGCEDGYYWFISEPNEEDYAPRDI